MQNNRYHNQMQLPEIGISGQEKLTNAKVLVIGAGGLGCPVLQNLVAAGVGTIGVVDGDRVAETNLHRQFLYISEDVGKLKVEVAVEVLNKQNPNITLIAFPDYFTSKNALEMVSDFQLIVDCTDDNTTRYLINDIALLKNIPMVYASIHQFEGQLSVFNYQNGPTYRCLFPEKERLRNVTCNDSGVLGVLPNLLGVLQANEVLKIILGIGDILSGSLLVYNGLKSTFQTFEISLNETEKEKGIQNGLLVLQQLLNFGIGTIAADDFYTEIEKEETIVIDIRESYEEPQLEYETVCNVPLAQLDEFLLTTPKHQKIILFCKEGSRSKLTGEYLIKNGFTNVFHLSNGIESVLKLTHSPK